VRNQLNAGLVPPSEGRAAEAQESRQRMLSIQARSLRDVAEAELARAIGATPGTPIEPVSRLDAPGAVDAAVAALVEQARSARAERAALTKRLTGADERRHAAAAGSRPAIALAGGFDYARPNPRIFPRDAAWRESWDATVSVGWTLFDGGRTRSEVAEAAAVRRAAEERLADFDSTLAVEVRQRVSELESNRAAIAAAGDSARRAGEA